jgi:hypothetical protein
LTAESGLPQRTELSGKEQMTFQRLRLRLRFLVAGVSSTIAKCERVATSVRLQNRRASFVHLPPVLAGVFTTNHLPIYWQQWKKE